MKDLKNIILEKILIHKNTNIHELDQIFNNVHELIYALKNFFNGLLKDDIIYHNEGYFFESDGIYLGHGQEVNGYFNIKFNTGDIIRCGLVKNKSRVLMQMGCYSNYRSFKATDKLTVFDDGYNFEKDNFREWINKLSDNKYPLLKQKFQLSK